MTGNAPDRRDFLTGKAIGKAARKTGEIIADSDFGHTHQAAPAARDTLRLTARAMACEFSVIMNAGEHEAIWSASEALDVVHSIEQCLTVYREDSEVSQLNAAPSESWTPVSSGLLDILQTSLRISRDTDGCFDITTDPIIRLWRQCRVENRIPSDEEIANSLTHVGMQSLEVNVEQQSAHRLAEESSLNFGAIGKGFAIDGVAAQLIEQGSDTFLLHGGRSSLTAKGQHTACNGWPVGIGNPLFTNRRLGTIVLRDQALSTSGSNIQFFRVGKQRFGHIIDPRTGWPANGAVSVTVVAPSATEADALSTAFYVMENARIAEYCENHPQVGAILVPFPAGDRRVQPLVLGINPDRLFWDAEQVKSAR